MASWSWLGGLEGGFFQTLGANVIQGARSVLENRVKGKATCAWPAGRKLRAL